MSKNWLLVVDLDKTLWDHEDISRLKKPFKRVSEYVIEDSSGVVVRVYRELVELLKWSKERGAIVAVVSWNVEDTAINALAAAGLMDLVDYYVIEDHPRKDLMVLKLLEKLPSSESSSALKCIVYIDDNEALLEQVRRVVENACTIRAWIDFGNYEELKNAVCKCLAKLECRDVCNYEPG